MLADKVVEIKSGIVVPLVNGGGHNVPLLCHTAGCYWIYHEAFGNPPQGWTYGEGSFSNVTGFMTEMAGKWGRKLRKGDAGGLANGTVLVFMDEGMSSARHTCIIRYDGKIGGYNQQSWLPGGHPTTFTTNDIGEIPWRSGGVTLADGKPGQLIGIEDETAVNFMRFNFGKAF